MNKQTTYELQVIFSQDLKKASLQKDQILDWFAEHQVLNFVEGAVDGLDLDHEFGLDDSHFYEDQGGQESPLSVFSFESSYLDELEQNITKNFAELTLVRKSMDSDTWQSGWKESFQPIDTGLFYIHPPWIQAVNIEGRRNLVVDPGMAFGSGQHVTTRLCLSFIQKLWDEHFNYADSKLLDLGTGSGILAMAMAKLGAKQVVATDLDHDAVRAAKENAILNELELDVRLGSVPDSQEGLKFDLVVANILFVVLRQLIPAIAPILKSSGKLVLSGLLEEDAEEMTRISAESGLRLISSLTDQGWISLMLQK
ncbi:MAG: 50S ribosomal protein L11 methyltransferase [Oligoflexales bacterium]|nr:50S ribosomal protein L11 methyltransferase [Oligoflexales bacterium]